MTEPLAIRVKVICASASLTKKSSLLSGQRRTAPPPEANPALNAPLVTWVASEHAAHVNGQILGRTDFAYTIYQHPKQVAYMYREGGFDVAGVDENFDKILGQHLQHVGMAMPGGMEYQKQQ